jgi:hypothetical protein
VALIEDLGAFLADFGVVATFNDSIATVIFDTPESNILGGRVQTTNYQITFRAADLPGLEHGAWLDVDGLGYSVVTVSAVDDGAFKTAALQKA